LNISDLTKKSIQTIMKNGDSITPIRFFDTFCGEARRNRVVVEDCELIKTYIEKLDTDFQKEIKRYNIRNIKEFLSYLTSALNRMNQNHLAKRHHSLLELTQKISETVLMIDNRDLEDLSGRTNAMLERSHSPENLDEMRREWARFTIGYKRERNREKLGKYISIDMNDDLDSIIDKVIPLLENRGSNKPTSEVVDILIKSVTPSLAKVQNRDIDKLYKSLRANPEKIYDKDVQEKLDQLHNDRVEIDRVEEKKSLNRASTIIDSLVDEVSDKKNDNNNDLDISKDIEKITVEISDVSDKKDSEIRSIFSSIGDRLSNIGKKTSSLFGALKKYSNKVIEVKDKLQKLENDISKNRREVDRDLLTKLRNRKGFETDLNDIEKEFQDSKQNYSVAIIDIDEFKKIVEQYGNDAGDLILRYFSKILKEYISVGDSSARFGEDRFVVSLPNRDLKNSINLIQQFKEKVKHTKFVYKNKRVIVTFSAGVTDRESVENYSDILNRANKMMAEAKKLGKDRVFPN